MKLNFRCLHNFNGFFYSWVIYFSLFEKKKWNYQQNLIFFFCFNKNWIYVHFMSWILFIWFVIIFLFVYALHLDRLLGLFSMALPIHTHTNFFTQKSTFLQNNFKQQQQQLFDIFFDRFSCISFDNIMNSEWTNYNL